MVPEDGRGVNMVIADPSSASPSELTHTQTTCAADGVRGDVCVGLRCRGGGVAMMSELRQVSGASSPVPFVIEGIICISWSDMRSVCGKRLYNRDMC